MRARWVVVVVVGTSCSSARPPITRESMAPVASPDAAPPRAAVTSDTLGEVFPETGYLVPGGDVTFSAKAPWRANVPAAVEEFSVEGQPPGCAQVGWTVVGPGAGGASAAPTKGTGTTLRVTFTRPGTYVVTARCGAERAVRVVTLCDFQNKLDAASNYYGESNDFALVGMDWLGTVSDASWTMHNHVSIGDGVLRASQGCPDTSHFVHEFGHVWEYQHGQNQLARGAGEQLKNLFTDVYDYGGADGVRAAVRDGKPIESFNLEQQAEIFAHDYYMKAQGWTGQYADDLAALTKPALASRPVVAGAN